MSTQWQPAPAGQGQGQGGTVIPFPGQGGQPQAPAQQPSWAPQPGQQPPPQNTVIRQEQGGQQWSPQNLPPVAQPQQQPQAPQAPAPAQVGLDTVLDGPGVPPELRGRTMREFNQIYGGLRQIAVQAAQGQPGQGQQPVPQPQPVPPVQQPQSQQPGQPAAMTQADFIRDPVGNTRNMIAAEIRNALQNQLMPMLAPVFAQTNNLSTQSAMSTISAEIGAERFQAMLPKIHEQLNGIDPRALSDPNVWRIAARSVAGEAALMGNQVPGTPAPAPSPFGTPPGAYPVQFVGQGNPVPNLNSFFSEQPGQAGVNGANGTNLSPAEREAARMMNMTEADYSAWKGGVSRSR